MLCESTLTKSNVSETTKILRYLSEAFLDTIVENIRKYRKSKTFGEKFRQLWVKLANIGILYTIF